MVHKEPERKETKLSCKVSFQESSQYLKKSKALLQAVTCKNFCLHLPVSVHFANISA